MKDVILWISLGFNVFFVLKSLNKPLQVVTAKKQKRADSLKLAQYNPKQYRKKKD